MHSLGEGSMTPCYFAYTKNRTITDLTREETTHRKNERDALAEAERERKKADDLLREINYRTIPVAQKMNKDLAVLRKKVADHKSGKIPLSKTRLTTVKRAIELTEKALDKVLLYGGYRKP